MARKIKQPYFDDTFKPRYESGGSLNKKSHPKEARSISTKHAMHVVLRSDVAHGVYSLINKATFIRKLINKHAELCGIKIYEAAIVSNHIHLLIYLKTNDHPTGRKTLAKFLRIVSGLIPRKVLGAERGSAKHIKFWLYRPYTRIVIGFKKGYQIAKDYVVRNHLEAIGVIPYQPRNSAKYCKTRAGPQITTT